MKCCRRSISCCPPHPMRRCRSFIAALGASKSRKPAAVQAKAESYEPSNAPIRVDDLARSLKPRSASVTLTLTHLPLSWNGATWPFRPSSAGLHRLRGRRRRRGGPGISVGAALALKGSGRLPIAICGDGDFCMGVTRAVDRGHYRIPLLVVVCNNRSFFNDELHQERVARMRNRPPENRWIGQRISRSRHRLCGVGGRRKARGIHSGDEDRRSHADVRQGDRRGRSGPGGGGRRAGRARLFGRHDRGDAARNRESLTPRAAAKAKCEARVGSKGWNSSSGDTSRDESPCAW